MPSAPGALSTPPRRARHGLQLLVGLAVSIGCLWWAVRDMLRDPQAWPQIRAAFANADYWMLAPFWLGLFVFYWLKAGRWRMLLDPIGRFHTLRELFPPMMVGFAFNNLLPAHLGEFVRVMVFSRQRRIPAGAVLSSVVLERVFDVLAIVAFLGLGLFFVPGLDPGIRQKAVWLGIGAAAAAAAALVFVTWSRPCVRIAEYVLHRVPGLPRSLQDRATHLLESSAHGLASLRRPRLMVGILATSLLQWAINGWLMHLSLASFGVSVSPWAACILLGVVAFGVTVPSSPGYFGVIQLCFIQVLKLFTTEQEKVFAASVVYHLAQYVPVTLLGLYYFSRTGLSMGQVEDAKAAVEGLPASEAIPTG